MDWDKLRVFQAAADAGSFTHAGQVLNLSQSAVSRQISALEQDLEVPLFHRHARGLLLTEQGDLLFRTVQDVMQKLDAVRTHLTDSREKPNGELRITTTFALGTGWLAPRVGEFMSLYPDIRLRIILTDEELDLGMREADLALRLREPMQPDLIRRRLFTVHYHAYASADYLKRYGQPRSVDDLDKHRLIGYEGGPANYLTQLLNTLQNTGRDAKTVRPSALTVNNMTAMQLAVQSGAGVAVLPDYLIDAENELVQLLPQTDMPELDCYLVYPEELKSVARVQVFRDFLVTNAQRWRY
ncbi:LysR family transcriptional regulator [Lichenihabitans sp. Uapishka_5]|uniref:LysR family transcriptional regulator n=1 Tax=Lichenihabitans sp. Uapishka_5 TaxID=3037302 RepID=UPI0029E7E8FD|nr:LysR family transcriptional regulator [Lichenihabitans sp. Uapishka_5]MDX7951963.1 LysR family transcriptional regulator [Lichenihabitans sp. Uapishka_5]